MSTADWVALDSQLQALSRSEKLQVIERLAQSLQTDDGGDALARLENLKRLQQAVAALPVENPDDGFSNRDHDKILYGELQ